MHLPTPFGYQNSNSTWRMVSHVVNKGNVQKSLADRGRLPVPHDGRRRREAAVARHRRLRRLRLHDAGRLQRRHRGLDLDRQRAHDRHVRSHARRRHHQRGAVHRSTVPRWATASRSRPRSWAATRATTTGRSRRTTRRRPRSPARPCAARRASTARRGRARGTASHLDTMTQCGISSSPACPVIRRRRGRPAVSSRRRAIPFSAGQTIRLHSEYQNNNTAPADRRDGHHDGLVRPDVAGLSARQGRDADASLAGARVQRVHEPQPGPRSAGLPGQRRRTRTGRATRRPRPPSQLTVGTPDANGAAAKSEGSVKVDAIVGNAGTPADEADARFQVSMTDVRRNTDRLPRLHGPAAARDHAPRDRQEQRPVGGRRRCRTRRSG